MSDNATLVDTNILVYAYDTFDKGKHEACKVIAESAFRGESELAVTNQILAELFFVLTNKLRNPLPVEKAEAIVCGIADSANWVKISYNHETVKRAISLSKTNNVSIWDSLIASTALDNGITKIYTENIKDFKNIAKLSPVNPIRK